MPILIGPFCASAVRRRMAGEAAVAAPASPTLSKARRDGRNCPDMCFPPSCLFVSFLLFSSPPRLTGEDTGGGEPQTRSFPFPDLKLAAPRALPSLSSILPRLTGEEA